MQFPKNRRFTYEEYVTWNDGNRYELMEGEVYMMSPAPSVAHQRISREIVRQLANYLRGKTCEVFSAPFDVRLNADAEDDTVVQPDIAVVCDPEKIKDGKSCKGAPDMVVEILSPSTAQRDQITKFNKYLEAGVREYWMIYPDTRSVQVYLLREGMYVSRAYGEADTVPVQVLGDCQITLSDVFPQAPSQDAPKGPETTVD